MRRSTALACLLPLLLAIALLTPAEVSHAQTAAPVATPAPSPEHPQADVAEQLAGIRQSLAEIAAILKRQTEQSDLGILMKRVELQQFLLMETNRQLQSQRDTRDSTQVQIDSMAQEFSDWDAETPIDERTATGEDLERLRMRKKWRERMDREQARLTEDLKKANAQITELENQAATTRDDITRWQASIDDWFERPAR